MKNITAKKLFNFYTFFAIFALACIIPFKLEQVTLGNSALFDFMKKISFWIFEEENNFSIYFPALLIIFLPLGCLFGLSEKIKTSKYAFLNCSILLTSLGYILFAKTHPEQSISVNLAISLIFCYFCTFFTENKNKKYFWICSYILLILSASIDSNNILAILFIILISSIILKNFKEIIKNLIIIILLMLVFKTNFNMLTHLTIKPILMVLTGSFPWILSLLFCFKKFRKLDIKNNSDRFLLLNIISILTIILCSMIINTSIILVYPFLSGIIGYIWYIYIFESENRIKRSVQFLVIAFIVSIAAGIILPALQGKYCFEYIRNILGL